MVTTGDGFEALAEATTASGGEVAAAAWFVSRSGNADIGGSLGVPAFCVASMVMSAWEAGSCAQCDAGAPVRLGLDLN